MTLLRELTLRPIEPALPQPVNDIPNMLDPYYSHMHNPQDENDKKLIQSFIEWLKANQDVINREISPSQEEEEQRPNTPSSTELDTPDLGPGVNVDPESNPESDSSISDENMGNPNKQGLIRTVNGAHLIYKRRMDNGLFDELWGYNTEPKMNKEYKIRSNILNGTDIDPNSTSSEDGSQYYTLWTVGNAQFVLISGLPN